MQDKRSHFGEQVERDHEQVFVEPKTKKALISAKSIEYSYEKFDTRVGKTYGRKRMLGLWKPKFGRKLVNSKMWLLYILQVKKRKRSRAFVKAPYLRNCFPEEVGLEEASIKLKERANVKNRSGAPTVTKSCCCEHNRGIHQFLSFNKPTGDNEETILNKSSGDKVARGHIYSNHVTLLGESRENGVSSVKRKRNWRLSEVSRSEGLWLETPQKKLTTGPGQGKNLITLEKKFAINQKETKENDLAFRANSALYKQYGEKKCARNNTHGEMDRTIKLDKEIVRMDTVKREGNGNDIDNIFSALGL